MIVVLLNLYAPRSLSRDNGCVRYILVFSFSCTTRTIFKKKMSNSFPCFWFFRRHKFHMAVVKQNPYIYYDVICNVENMTIINFKKPHMVLIRLSSSSNIDFTLLLKTPYKLIKVLSNVQWSLLRFFTYIVTENLWISSFKNNVKYCRNLLLLSTWLHKLRTME